jgi:DNA topoisomerase-1
LIVKDIMQKKNNILVIVESPAKVKTISKFLGKGYLVRATFGHIFDLARSGEGNFGVNIEKGFIPKYQVINDKKDKIKAIVTSAKMAKEIYIASDSDREGEAIAWHLKSVLDKTGLPIRRVVFNEITKEEIQRAIASPGDLDKNLYDAQQARRVLDRIVGFSVSPTIISKFGPKLSAGRVQSVAVKIVVERENEIESFEPKEYWNITAALSKDKKEKFIAKLSKTIKSQKAAKDIKAELSVDSYKVIKVEGVERKRNPPPPLITSSLAGMAASRYKFATARTMKAAQKLYEAGHITYMRTDSIRSSPKSIQACRDWLSTNNHDIPNKPNRYASKNKAQDAHEAIRPTTITSTPKNTYFSSDEQKVYNIIWERFIASQMMPAKYFNVNITIKTSSGHILKASGRTLKYKGWLSVSKTSYDKDVTLPSLDKGDEVFLVSPNVVAEQKFTQPPPRYSEKTLISELEKRGIGRPSTFATIMSKITSRSFVESKSNTFVATTLGKRVIADLNKHFSFMEVNYTANVEKDLDKIASGKLKYKDFLGGFYEPFKKEVKASVLSEYTDYGFKCPNCNKRMLLKHGKYGYYMCCYDYPKTCKTSFSCVIENGKPVAKQTNVEIVEGISCPKCGSDMVQRDGSFGPFYSCVKYPKCYGSRKVPYGKECPKCGDELYATTYHEKNVLFCMGYPDCKHSEKLPDDAITDPKKICKEPNIPRKLKKLIKS